jgi:outer membrane protein OmpA-like peptidoglycan-associated protein
MFLRLKVFIVAMILSGAACAAPADYTAVMAADADGSADSALTGRYDGSTIVGQVTEVFKALTLPAGPADPKAKAFSKTVTQTGRILRTLYVSPGERSSLEVFGNYIDALKAKGFATVFACDNASCGGTFKDLKYRSSDPTSVVISDNADTRRVFVSRAMFNRIADPRYALLQKGEAGQETYVAVFAAQNTGGSYGDVSKALRSRVGVLIELVEPGQREDKMVTVTADEIGTTLGASGRVAFYGIYFDFDKAVIRPESQPQLVEMISYLNANPAMRFYVVGHTDNTGTLDYNLKLSGQRAQAVVEALMSAGVDGRRLVAKGLGPLAPLTANTSGEGQAKNRRVELVAQ